MWSWGEFAISDSRSKLCAFCGLPNFIGIPGIEKVWIDQYYTCNMYDFNFSLQLIIQILSINQIMSLISILMWLIGEKL